MKEPTELDVTINERNFTLSLPVRDEALLEGILDALEAYVKGGTDLTIRQTYMTSPSDSVKILTRLISKASQIQEWRGEIKQLIQVLKRQARVEV